MFLKKLNNKITSALLILSLVLVSYASTLESNENGNENGVIAAKVTAATVTSVAPTKENYSKRDVKSNDLNSAAAAEVKSYDPPPEFYRGPGSTGITATSPAYPPTTAFLSKPFAFPDTSERNKFGLDNKYIANAYNKWQQLKGAALGLGTNGAQDRISVGHYGNPEHGGGGASHVYTSNGGGNYGSYTGSQHVDYGHTNAVHYPSTSHGGSGYYGGSSGEGIPFDVYGGKGHYAGAGGEYSYTYPDSHEPAAHKEHDWSQKALLAKSFLIPLASAAVLGIAAALVSNPLLLQLGTVSGVGPAVAVGKRRRRRRDLNDVTRGKGSLTTVKTQLKGDALAYRGYQCRNTRF